MLPGNQCTSARRVAASLLCSNFKQHLRAIALMGHVPATPHSCRCPICATLGPVLSLKPPSCSNSRNSAGLCDWLHAGVGASQARCDSSPGGHQPEPSGRSGPCPHHGPAQAAGAAGPSRLPGGTHGLTPIAPVSKHLLPWRMCCAASPVHSVAPVSTFKVPVWWCECSSCFWLSAVFFVRAC